MVSHAQWRSEGPAGPATAGGPAGLKGPARGPPGRSSRRNPLARGPNKLVAGGPENRRYATAHAHIFTEDQAGVDETRNGFRLVPPPPAAPPCMASDIPSTGSIVKKIVNCVAPCGDVYVTYHAVRDRRLMSAFLAQTVIIIISFSSGMEY